MPEKKRHSLTEIKTNGGYHLGMVKASLYLPKMETVNPDGTVVTFSPDQNHIPYLRRSNENPMLAILENQQSIYGRIPMSDGRVILVAGASSPYVREGEHLILWALSGDNFRFQPNVNYLSPEQGQKLFSTIANVIEIFERKGLSYFIGINSNDEEYQRQSVQSIRDGAHVHCVGLDQNDVNHLEPIKPEDDDRILHDPFALLTNRLLEKVLMPKILRLDKNSELTTRMISYDEYTYKYPQGTSLVLRDGVNTLRNPNFFSFVQRIHQLLESEYQELIRCFTDNSPDTFRARVEDDIDTISFFKRPLPLPREEIMDRLSLYFERYPELNGDRLVENGLRYMARVIKSASEVVKENAIGFDERLGIPVVEAKTMNTKIIMEGLSYNMMIFSHPDTGEVLLTLVPRVTTGGSPLDSIGIKKDQYPVTKKEFKVHIAEMDKRLDSTVAELINRDTDILPGSAFKGIPKEKSEF